MLRTLQVLQAVGPHVAPALVPSLQALLPSLCGCAGHPAPPVQAAAAACVAALAGAWTAQLMPPLLRELVRGVTRFVVSRAWT